MFTRKLLAISIGIAITVVATAPACFAKKTSRSVDEAKRSDASTSSGAYTIAQSVDSDSDDDLKEVAAVVEKADKLVSAGRFQPAIEVLRDGLKEHGQNPHLHERLSKVFYASGSVDDAISELLLAISIDQNVFEYYSDVAWLYSISGKYSEAVKYSKAAISRDPNKSYPYVVMGFSLGCLGKRQQAIETLKKAIELDSKNSTAHLYLADVIANGGDYEHALPMYQRSLKLYGHSGAAYLGLGDCFRKLGHPKEALAAYKKAVDLSPQDATARGHLGFALSQSGDHMGAMQQGMRANSIRLGQYWGKFMGMFVAVWAGIFLVFGTMFGAMFMGSRFVPVSGETILNQFVMVVYKESSGRFVITDKRIVFIPEFISRWMGATRVSIQREQINSVTTESTDNGGTVTITVSESPLLFRVPALVYGPMTTVLAENRLMGNINQAEVEEPVRTPEPVPSIFKIPEKEEQSDTAQFEKYAVIAASFDFREGKTEQPTLRLNAVDEESVKEQAISSPSLFKEKPNMGDTATAKKPEKKDSKADKKKEKDTKPPLKPLAKLEPLPSSKVEETPLGAKAQALPKLDESLIEKPAETSVQKDKNEKGKTSSKKSENK